MIDQSSRKMAALGHAMIILGILLPLWMIFFHHSERLFERDKIEIVVPILAACVLLLGKALAIPAGIVSGHDGALKTSLYCDVLGVIVNVLLTVKILPVTSAGIVSLLSVGASLLGFIFFLNYLQGTAEYLGDEKLAEIPGKLYKGCGLIVLTLLVSILSIAMGLFALVIKLFYALLIAWMCAYIYAIAGTGYKMLNGSET